MTIKMQPDYKRWEFENKKIRKVKPEDLINKKVVGSDEEKAKEFLLTLALIFNDAKTIVMLNDTVSHLYKDDVEDDSDRPGIAEKAGVRLYVARMLFGHLYETLIFLKDRSSIYESSYIQSLIKTLTEEEKLLWEFVVSVSKDGNTDDKRFIPYKDFIEILYLIRNKISFHYQTRVLLSGGFRRFFYKKIKDIPKENSEFACRSLEKTNFLKSRYYYADAASQGYLVNAIGEHYTMSEFVEKSLELSAMICRSINSLLDKFFDDVSIR